MMNKKDSLLEKLDRMLSPIGTKIGNQIHLKAISSGMMFGLPFIVVGSLFLIFANPPINMDLYDPQTANIFVRFLAAWKNFASANYELLTAPYNMTMGIFGLSDLCFRDRLFLGARVQIGCCHERDDLAGGLYACGRKQRRWSNFH